MRTCLPFRLALALHWFVVVAGFGVSADKPTPTLDVRPVPHETWGNSPQAVQAILVSAGQELYRYFPDRPLRPILVEPSGGPITHFERGPGGEYRVRLDTGDNLWAQWVYQFSHELGHILSNYDDRGHRNKWFEETICEVASQFVLHRLADAWSKDPAPAHWQKYSPALRQYAIDRADKHPLPKDMSLADWYATHARELTRTGYDRPRNSIVAGQLLPLFQKSPEHWEAIAYLAKAKKGHGESFPEYLKAWQSHCPARHREFVGVIGQRFGLNLDQVQLQPAPE